MSLIVSLILLSSYAGGLLFSLRSHRALFNPTSEAEEHVDDSRVMSVCAMDTPAGPLSRRRPGLPGAADRPFVPGGSAMRDLGLPGGVTADA